MKRLSQAAAGLGVVAVLLTGGNANARFSCNSAGDLGLAEAKRMAEAATVTVLSITNIDDMADRLSVRFSLGGETPCMARYRDGYCLNIEVQGQTHRECFYGTPRISNGAFVEHIEVGPRRGRFVHTTAYARFGYFGPAYYTPWSDGFTTDVNYSHYQGSTGSPNSGR